MAASLGTLMLPLFLILPLVSTQALLPQTDTFASNYTLTASQSNSGNLTALIASNAAVAINFERSNWASSSSNPPAGVVNDPFYLVPSSFTNLTAPGTLLKLEAISNTTLYTLPPNTALSRILYVSETVNNTAVPASAYILWPFSPLLNSDGKAQVVAFGHGFAGEFGDCAPSHYRTLSYEFQAPFTLALSGYVVVGPDYQGLGVNVTNTGSRIRHPIEVGAAAANDLVFAVEAARKAFPKKLGNKFVVMGHSEGGGAAWAAAERQAAKPVDGYLGTVAASPLTNVSAQVELYESLGITAISGAATQAWGMLDIFPGFQLSDFLTPEGVARTELLAELGGCNSATEVLLAEPQLFKGGWWKTPYANLFWNLTTNGGKAIGEPMLIVQGSADPAVPELITEAALNQTCDLFPQSRIEYLSVNGTTHVPTLYASQRQWLAWIAERFAGIKVAEGCKRMKLESFRAVEVYQPEVNWFMEWATQAYELA